MKLSAATSFLACMLLVPGALSARATLYLLPVVNEPADGLRLSDIARIEYDRNTTDRISEIMIDRSLYNDGYIDRTEVLSMVRQSTDGCFMIVGSATRVSAGHERSNRAEAVDIKHGDAVKFIYRKGLIRIELRGTALSDGKAGDMIQVRLRKERTARGRIIANRMIVSEK